jgi:23S rRNA pseudouridine1911/1915/1917 synthase
MTPPDIPASTHVPGSTLVVPAVDAGRRLDDFLATALAVGRRAAVRLAGRARVNGRHARKGDRVREGDVVVVPPTDAAASVASDAAPVVLRATPDVLVVDKPAGLPTVALRGAGGDSLAARIAARFPECATVGAPGESGLVHRLDTGTSGVLLVARTPQAYAALRADFRAHAVAKEYLALVGGRLERAVRIDAPIGQHRASLRRVRAIATPGAARRYVARDACTEVAPERVLGDATLVRARTTTGARHQIRVHLASIGHPLLGDPLYGERDRSAGDEGFLLHASRIEWTDPATGIRALDEAPLPASWQERLSRVADASPARERAGRVPR